MTVYSYLQAILISEFWTTDDLNEWIINVISVSDKYQYELYDLLYVNDYDKVSYVLADLAMSEDYFKYNNTSVPYVVLGYYYWRYKLGRISLNECIILCGQYADNVGTNIDCSEFYDLLDNSDIKKVNETLEEICGELMTEAQRQYDIIDKYAIF